MNVAVRKVDLAGLPLGYVKLFESLLVQCLAKVMYSAASTNTKPTSQAHFPPQLLANYILMRQYYTP